MKNFKFINNAAKKAFLSLPQEQITQFGLDLHAIQQEKTPYSDFKCISTSVGTGAIELIENGSPAYRVVYCTKYLDTVYILHAFKKTPNGVDKKNMATAKSRYKLMMKEVLEVRKEGSK